MDSELSPLLNSLCITHWENYRSQTLPTDSTDEPIYLPDHRWQWHASIGQIHLCGRGWDNCRLESGDQSCRVRPSQGGYLRYHRHPQPQCSWGVYKGLEIATGGKAGTTVGTFLYVTNFRT